jgi:MinD-like ATPase involved in chromosome partitioning or flagellar assembly
MPHIVAVSGPKEPAGKTFLAVNLALAFGRQGVHTVLLDLNEGAPATDDDLRMPVLHDLNALANGECCSDDVLVPYAHLVDLVALGTPSGWEDPANMGHLLPLVPLLEGAGVIVVDMPGEDSPGRIPAARAASVLLAVVAPEQVGSGEAHYSVNQLFHQSGDSCVRIVVNRVTSDEMAEAVCSRLEYDCTKILGIPAECLAYVPELTPGNGSERGLLAEDSTLIGLMSGLADRLIASAATKSQENHVLIFVEELYQAYSEDEALSLSLLEMQDQGAELSGEPRIEALSFQCLITETLAKQDDSEAVLQAQGV